MLNDLGYLTGVMLGDGYLDKHKSHYAIRLETTDKRLEHPICPKCFIERNQLLKVPKEWNRFCGLEAKS